MRPAALPSVILHPFCPQLVHEIGTQCSSRMSRPDNFASVEVCRTGFLARPCGRSDSSTSKTHKQPQPYKSTRNYKYQTHYLHDCPLRTHPHFPLVSDAISNTEPNIIPRTSHATWPVTVSNRFQIISLSTRPNAYKIDIQNRNLTRHAKIIEQEKYWSE